MENYDPKIKEKYIKLMNSDTEKTKFIKSFEGKSEISYLIVGLFLEDDDKWREVNDAEYIFNHYFYNME